MHRRWAIGLVLTTVGCSHASRPPAVPDGRAGAVYESMLAFGDSVALRHLGATVGPSPRLALSPRIVPVGEWLESSDATVARLDQHWLDSLKGQRRIAGICEPAQRLWECGVQQRRMAAALSTLEWPTSDRVTGQLYLSHPQTAGMRSAFHVVWRLRLSRTGETWHVIESNIMSIT